jgi:uncharacterized protein (TIGR02600 family)
MKADVSTSLRHPERGVALVIVLSMLVLMSALLVAFMGTVSTERTASRAASATFDAKQAYESAVNLVIAQIREATSDASGDVSWASQPGALRTFNANGDLELFKLYSSDRMRVSQNAYAPESVQESGFNPSNPREVPPGFVNINDPIFIPARDGSRDLVEPRYPIANPYARLTPTGTTPSTFGNGKVQGFDGTVLDHPSGARTRYSGRESVVQDMPMRVKWLYQLKDGTMVAPDENQRLRNASKENPPIARVAFWTDDDTCKLNVNVAGENTFWDTPHASSTQESGNVGGDGMPITGMDSLYLSASQPAAREYQRFPGHPSTTSLSPALRWLAPNLTDLQFKEAIYRLSPRLVGGRGTSMARTRNTDPDFEPADYRVSKRDRMFVTLDDYWFRPDRSPISRPGFHKVFRLDNSGQVVTDTQFTTLTPDAMDQIRFFLTANNRAPDLNLFGKPRIGIWPIHEEDNPNPEVSRRSGFDELIAFCGTVAKKPYYFVRANSFSSNYDYALGGKGENKGRNKQIVETYLSSLVRKAVPGGGGAAIADKYGANNPVDPSKTEMDRILLTIFDFIRSTNLVDTGRKSNSGSGRSYPFAYTPNYENSNPPVYNGSRKPNLASGQVTPTVVYGPGGTALMKGFGRAVNLSEVAILFYYDDPATAPAPPITPPYGLTMTPPPQAGDLPGDDPVRPTNIKRNGNVITNYIPMRAVLLTEMYTVTPWYPALSEAYSYRVRETTPLRVASSDGPAMAATNINLADGSMNHIEVDANRTGEGRFFMPTRGFSTAFLFDTAAPTASNTRKLKIFSKPSLEGNLSPSQQVSRFPFYSKRIWLPATENPAGNAATTQYFNFEGGTLELEFFPPGGPPTAGTGWAALPNTAELLQKITVQFPNAVLPVPRPASGGNTHPNFITRIGTQGQNVSKFPSIDPNTTSTNNRQWIPFASSTRGDSFDTIRSLEAKGVGVHGDYRMIAGNANVPQSAFAPSGADGDYQNRALRSVMNFRSGWGRRYDRNAPLGKMTEGASPRSDKIPDVPIVGNNPARPLTTSFGMGDYDRGISKHMDGAFINRPDEGNVRFRLNDNPGGGGHLPYYRGGDGYEEVGVTFFTPNRMVSSPVILGSLPTGVFSGRPWQTLLFSPPTNAAHPGTQGAPDHFLLDLFTMPVVEPWAISEPLSTAGRVNLNHRLAPFGYVKVNNRSMIERSTALHGVLKDLWQMTIRNGMPNSGHNETPLSVSDPVRQEVDRFKTIERVINPRLDARKYFKSATEICEMDLLTLGKGNLPAFSDPSQRASFWARHDQTGDNMREKPYAHIYSRITTKSNTYTVHCWAQRIAKNPSTKDDEWDMFDESRDRVLGEYRGSTQIERYIDPNDPAMGDLDYVKSPNSPNLERFYRFRILGHKRFTPQN